MSANKYRIQQVVIKIGRCLFYRDHHRIMPYENCKDIRLCEREEDVPELYRLSWAMSKVNVSDLFPSEPSRLTIVTDLKTGQPLAAYQKVFDYRSAYLAEEGMHLYSLRFWEAFMFCIAFKEPDLTAQSASFSYD
jgi:hypothetical protein